MTKVLQQIFSVNSLHGMLKNHILPSVIVRFIDRFILRNKLGLSFLSFYPELQVSGLKYGTKYNYRVFAENAAGVSEPSNVVGPLLADDPHGETCSVLQ